MEKEKCYYSPRLPAAQGAPWLARPWPSQTAFGAAHAVGRSRSVWHVASAHRRTVTTAECMTWHDARWLVDNEDVESLVERWTR
jgi:hypothetical protein